MIIIIIIIIIKKNYNPVSYLYIKFYGPAEKP